MAKFETLKQLCYDLDTVYRDQYCVSDHKDGLPTDQELQEVNRSLTDMIPVMEKESKKIQGHLLLMVEWWKEYEAEYQVC